MGKNGLTELGLATSAAAAPIELMKHLWSVFGTALGTQNEVDGFGLRHATRRKSLAKRGFKRVGEFVDALVLGPEVRNLVAAAHAQRDEVVDLELFTTGLADPVAELAVVVGDDGPLGVAFDVAFAIRNFLGVAVGVGTRAGRAWRHAFIGSFGEGSGALDGLEGQREAENEESAKRKGEFLCPKIHWKRLYDA